MGPPATTQLPCNEANINLAIQAINQEQIQCEYRAALAYNVPRSTLHNQRARIAARRDRKPNSKKLTKLEEEVIVRHILELDSRGFAPSLGAVRDMADKLLTKRGAGYVGRQWPRNFINRIDSLTTRFNRPYDRQRTLCEDPKVIRP
jgi:hypothetical protein